jgi:uncharacterized RDD family membrane protein YckC
MIPSGSKKLLSALLLAFAALTGAALFAQQKDDKAPPPPPPAEKSPDEKIAEVVDRAADKVATTAEKLGDKIDEAAQKLESKAAGEGEPEMRRLDTEEGSEDSPKSSPKKRRSRSHRTSSDEPSIGMSQTVAAGKSRNEAVTIGGDTVVDGDVSDAAVSVFGNTTVNGSVGDAAVSVFGNTTVNGKVGQVAVAVLGDVVLGPQAEVNDVVAVMGRVQRSPDAVVHGNVQQIGGFGPFQGTDWIKAYFFKCVLWARPLWFGENLGWAWLVAAGFLVFYLFLTLLFPRGVARCAETLEQKPGYTILATVLTMMLTPLAIILLAITGVGLAIVPFILAGLFCAGLFGKAAILGWLGRRIVGKPGEETMARDNLLAVLVGGLIVMLLYCIPVLGFILYKVFGILGTGMVIYTIIVATRKEKPARPAPAAPLATHAPAMAAAAPAAMPTASPGFTGAAEQSAGFTAPAPAAEGSPFTAPAVAVPPAAQPPLITADTMPRAGFWLRTGAAFLDFLLIGISCGILDNFIRLEMPGFLFLAIATYSAAMWKNKGTTIGGVICGLKVVRLDDKPIDWTIAIVRALSGFLSFFAAGVGFIWVAFDDQKQSWHDKIAGTTIVKVPKGTSLL